MTMTPDRLVRAVARLRRQKARRWPRSVRRAVIDHAVAGRVAGRTWAAIAEELGMSPETLRRWASPEVAKSQGTALAPVEVVQVAAPHPDPTLVPPLTLTSPAGYRVDGLDFDTTLALLRVLP